eukprot:583626_1
MAARTFLLQMFIQIQIISHTSAVNYLMYYTMKSSSLMYKWQYDTVAPVMDYDNCYGYQGYTSCWKICDTFIYKIVDASNYERLWYTHAVNAPGATCKVQSSFDGGSTWDDLFYGTQINTWDMIRVMPAQGVDWYAFNRQPQLGIRLLASGCCYWNALFLEAEHVPTTAAPTLPTLMPSVSPSRIPTTAVPTGDSNEPTATPSSMPSKAPTLNPTFDPSAAPSTASVDPTATPSYDPTIGPTTEPTNDPTVEPTTAPSPMPTHPSPAPTLPTLMPSVAPSRVPTSAAPTVDSNEPTATPTNDPTVEPTTAPSPMPTHPSPAPTERTSDPSITPTESTSDPSITPTIQPTANPFVATFDTENTANPFADNTNDGDSLVSVLILVAVICLSTFFVFFVVKCIYDRVKALKGSEEHIAAEMNETTDDIRIDPDNLFRKPLEQWEEDDVYMWLLMVNKGTLKGLAEILKAQRIKGSHLEAITEEMLKEFGIALGDRMEFDMVRGELFALYAPPEPGNENVDGDDTPTEADDTPEAEGVVQIKAEDAQGKKGEEDTKSIEKMCDERTIVPYGNTTAGTPFEV